MCKFNIPDIEPRISDEEYWLKRSEVEKQFPILTPLSKPCGDCAIKTGFYVPVVDNLLKQPKEVQDVMINRWYCHNACGKQCKGVLDYVEKYMDEISSTK